MATKVNSRPKRPQASDKERELRRKCRRLQAELADVQRERDIYKRSLLYLTRKDFVFTREELRAMEANPVSSEEILQAARAGAGK
jgi:hypothetical protein